jgi:cytochrome c oxidase subunit 1
MVYNLYYHLKHGEIAPANPWKGVTLEWQIPSPPSHENFDVIPEITGNPYVFGNKPQNNQN